MQLLSGIPKACSIGRYQSGGILSRAAAPPHRKEPVEVVGDLCRISLCTSTQKMTKVIYKDTSNIKKVESNHSKQYPNIPMYPPQLFPVSQTLTLYQNKVVAK